MAEYIDREPNKVLDNLKGELREKHQGYATEFVLAGEPFSDHGIPRIEIVLIDPEDEKVAYRRASRGLSGPGRDIWRWQKGHLVKAVEEGLTWLMEMEEVEGYRLPAGPERFSGS